MNLYFKVLQHGKCSLTRCVMESLTPKRAQFISNEDIEWINLPKGELWMKGVIEEETKNSYTYIFESRGRIVKIIKLIIENLGGSQARYKRNRDRKANKRKFKMEELVFVLLLTNHNKLLMIWIISCRVVIEKEKNNYGIGIKEKIKTLYLNLAKKYIRRKEIMKEIGIEMISLIIMVEQEEDKRREQLLMTDYKSEERIKDINMEEKLLSYQRKDIKKKFIKYKEIFGESSSMVRGI